MAKKQKQKESTKTKGPDVQPAAAPPISTGPYPRSSPASKHASVTPRGPTPGLSSPHFTSPKSVSHPFEEEEQEAGRWQAQTTGWGNSPHIRHQGDGWAEDHDEEEEEADTVDGSWGNTAADGPHSPAGGANSPVVGGWDQPQELESHGGWGGNLVSAVTNAFGLGSHSQAQTRSSEPATAAQGGVTRKSTLKKKPPVNHEAVTDPPAPATPPTAAKRVAFTSYSSSFDVRSSSPPLFPIPNTAPPPKVNKKPMHTRSQSQGAFARGWGEPDQPPPAAVGAWMQWGQEAMANEEARKHGMTRFATTIQANVPATSAHPPPAPPSAPMPASYLPRGHSQPNISSLQSQLHNILGTGAYPSAQQHAPAMHHRQQSLPTQMASQAWQAWGNPPKIAQTHPHAPQMQPANSWGSNDWDNQEAGAWGQPVDQGGYDDQGVGGGKAGDVWGEGGEDAWGKGGGGGGYDPWGNDNAAAGTDSKEKKSHKRGRSKSTSNVGGWGGAPARDNGWDQQDDNGWGGKKAASSGGHGGRSEWDAIPEEDEEDEDGYDDDMYTEPEDYDSRRRHRRRQSGISYQYQSPSQQPTTPVWEASGTPFAGIKGTANGVSLMPSPDSSKTMNFASGRMTTVFELSPRQGLSEFMWSDGAGLQHAQRALFSRRRLAKDRIHWAFSPDNDPRVSSLIRWIDAMANGLATVGLQKLLETGQRGALITNADYRANTSPGGPTQPAFDWITLSQAKLTCDRIFQESVVTYKPHLQVIVFVFLLSNSQNSMAVWRRKVTIPEGVRAAHRREIAHIMEVIPQDKTVFVDEALPPEPPPPEPPKKKRGFWKRLFGIGRKKK